MNEKKPPEFIIKKKGKGRGMIDLFKLIRYVEKEKRKK